MSSEATPQQFTVPMGPPGSDRCCEWRWPDRDAAVWNQSSKEGNQAYNDGPLTEEGRQALLKYFQLEPYADEFPLETIRTLAPCDLFARTVSFSVGTIDTAPLSDRIGARIPATLAA